MKNLSDKIQNTINNIRQVKETFGDGLYASTSAGIDSALLPHILNKAGVNLTFIHADTGFLFPETIEFRDKLKEMFKLQIFVIGPPDKETLERIGSEKLWEKDIIKYRELTKIEPLKEAIKNLGVTALLSAVRADQTQNRAGLNFDMEGKAGERRIHPFLEWTRDDVDKYFKQNNLPRNKLHQEGYGSIDDWTVTTPEDSRNGRPDECIWHCDIGK